MGQLFFFFALREDISNHFVPRESLPKSTNEKSVGLMAEVYINTVKTVTNIEMIVLWIINMTFNFQ